MLKIKTIQLEYYNNQKLIKMKRIMLIVTCIALVNGSFSQENLFNISAGYSWANIDISEYVESNDEQKKQATGWRINATYDFHESESKISYGLAVGYSSIKTTYNGTVDTNEFHVTTVPLYFAPKFIFGNEKINGFVKLAIGGESTTYKRTNRLGETKVSGLGFYGGAGAGLMFFFSEKIFLNAEYEIAYTSSSYYNGEWLQSAMLGIGIGF